VRSAGRRWFHVNQLTDREIELARESEQGPQGGVPLTSFKLSQESKGQGFSRELLLAQARGPPGSAKIGSNPLDELVERNPPAQHKAPRPFVVAQ